MKGPERSQKAQAAAQGCLTSVCTKIDGLKIKTLSETTSALEDILDEFDKSLAKLEEVQSEIELEISPDELDDYLDQADAVRQQARHKRLLCAERLKELTAGNKDIIDSASTTGTLHARLPKLEYCLDLMATLLAWDSFINISCPSESDSCGERSIG